MLSIIDRNKKDDLEKAINNLKKKRVVNSISYF